MSLGPEILTLAEARDADAGAAASGTATLELMRRAGEGAAEAVMARFAPTAALVLCGPGSNGGDGFVLARRLKEAGWTVRVAAAPTAPSAGDAKACRAALGGRIDPLEAASLDRAGLVVDALFGAGLSRPLEGPGRGLLEDANRRGVPVAALDLPSGLAGDLGRPLGFAPQAALTIAFHRKKIAHLIEPGRSLCGETVVVDLGLPPPEGASLWENGPELWPGAVRTPGVQGHKASRGALMVVSGSASRTGAARLAARAGLRTGAGLVTVLSPPSAVLVHALALEAAMVVSVAGPEELAAAAAEADAVVIGPAAGVGETTAANLRALKARGIPLVVDADALTSFREDPHALFDLLGPDDVLTPHPGEFERIFPGLLDAGPERIAAARTAAARSGAVVLLKGPDTVVAEPDGRCVVNANAAPWLATAGSGDVLAGIIGALLAQGVKAFEAAAAGAYLHGAAGTRFGPGLISEDLPGLLPDVLRGLLGGGTEAQRSRSAT